MKRIYNMEFYDWLLVLDIIIVLGINVSVWREKRNKKT